MRRVFLILAVCALCVSCKSDYFGPGKPVTLHFPISADCADLTVNSAFEVSVSEDVTDVVVTIGEHIVDRLAIDTVGGELSIGLLPNTINKGKATAVIPANLKLRRLMLSGASTFKGNLKDDYVWVRISGASDYSGSVSAKEVELDISGASSASITGSSQDKLFIYLRNASNLMASGLLTQEVEGEMSGASKADVTCCTRLAVNLSTASELTYGVVDASCDPVVECVTSGASSVQHRP